MTTTEHLSASLSLCPLFREIPQETFDHLLSNESIRIRCFRGGEEIPLLCGNERALVILTDGHALAYSSDAERSVILRTITKGTAFGVSILFSKEDPVSVIRAKTSAEALYLPSHVVYELIDESPAFRRNYIAFLSGRIRFLNRRIACYTAGSAERRLALYLSDLPEIESNVVVLDTPMTDLCELLDIGRASLYRALRRLADDGLIERDDRRIRIPDLTALRRYGAIEQPHSSPFS